ncbi:hypothetical protein [Lentibacter sp.]|uniref:hypothetical protein n=1 Tax=Lentibacter sp. TaxID=2024994 RepID=UPI003F6D6689
MSQDARISPPQRRGKRAVVGLVLCLSLSAVALALGLARFGPVDAASAFAPPPPVLSSLLE